MKIKTSKASKKQLDWALAEAEDSKPELKHGNIFVPFANFDGASLKLFSHAMPSVCMGLIEQYSLAFSECDTRHLYDKPDTLWRVVCRDGSGYGESEVLAKAVARCVIAMKLGDEFECPSELGGWFDELTNTERNA